MPAVKVYLIGCVAVGGVWLSLHFNEWFLLLFAGALTWAIYEWRALRRNEAIIKRRGDAELQMLEAAARKAQHDADLRGEDVERARAQRALIPAGYVGAQLYRPEHTNLYHLWTYKQEVSPAVVKVAEDVAQAAIAPALPRAASLYDLLPTLDAAQGRILLGFDGDGPIWLSVDELLSVAMAGNSGRGKSKALLWLTLQLIRQGVTVIVLDGKGDLRRWLGTHHAVAYTPAEIRQSVDSLIVEADWRLEQASSDADATFKPVLAVIDELDLVAGRYGRTVDLIERLTKKTRSVNVHGIYSNQSVPADLVGGVATRGVIVSRICLYCDDEAARMIGVRANNGAAALLQQLAPPAPQGLAVARTAVFGWRIIAFPYVPDSAIAQLLYSVPPLAPLPMKQPVSPPPAQVAEITPESPDRTPPGGRGKRSLVSEDERQEILEYATQGLSPAGIATAMHRRNAFADIVRLVLQEEGLI